MKATFPLSRYIIIATTGGTFALTSGVSADSAGLSEKSSWLLGNFTQNAPCKGDGSDPVELKVRVAADQIESKSGICNFLSVTPETNRQGKYGVSFSGGATHRQCDLYPEGQRYHRRSGPRQQLFCCSLSMPKVTECYIPTAAILDRSRLKCPPVP
jgi:hypothetical protein